MPDLDQLDLRYLSHRVFSPEPEAEIYFEERGSGPHLTFINNFYIVSPVWRNFTDKIAEGHTILTYDLRNQGASSWAGPVVFSDHVEDLRKLLDHLGVERTNLVGTSISTLIVRDFAIRYPERVESLTLIGPAFSPNGGLRRKLVSRSWLTSLETGGTERLFDHLYPLVFADQTVESIGNAGYLALRENFLALLSVSSIRENLISSLDVDDDPKDLAGITAPTLVINGDGDFAWSRSMIEDILALMPDAREVTIPRAAHIPYFDEPEAFQQALLGFLAELAKRAESATGATPEKTAQNTAQGDAPA